MWLSSSYLNVMNPELHHTVNVFHKSLLHAIFIVILRTWRQANNSRQRDFESAVSCSQMPVLPQRIPLYPRPIYVS